MPLYNDLKRIFFGAKSVAKHQADKAGDKMKDVGRQAGDAAEELAENTKQAARELADKAPGYIAKGKDALEDLSDKIWQEVDPGTDKADAPTNPRTAAENAKLRELNKSHEEPIDFETFDTGLPPKPGAADPEQFGDLTISEPPTEPGKKKYIDFESEYIQDAKAKASAAAQKADELVSPGLDAAARAGNAAKEKIGAISEAVGEKALEVGDDLLSKAAETGARAKMKYDEFADFATREAEKMRLEDSIEQAKVAAEQAEARAKAFDGKESNRDTSESILTGTDSFFDRAARFADGDYHDEGGKDLTIGKNPDATSKQPGGTIRGFGDADGDGDSLIDDAILDEDDDTDHLDLPALPQ